MLITHTIIATDSLTYNVFHNLRFIGLLGLDISEINRQILELFCD